MSDLYLNMIQRTNVICDLCSFLGEEGGVGPHMSGHNVGSNIAASKAVSKIVIP